MLVPKAFFVQMEEPFAQTEGYGPMGLTAAETLNIIILRLNNCLIIKHATAEKGVFPMKKTYQIEVDCANCANLMENAARKTAGVQNATVNFMTQKMIVEFGEGQQPAHVMADVVKACKKVEPDCEIFL